MWRPAAAPDPVGARASGCAYPDRDLNASGAGRAGAGNGADMGQPVLHFEIIGKNGKKLQDYYAELFGWRIDASNPMNYGMVEKEGDGIAGGIGPGPADYPGHVTIYVGVPDVEAALAKAESLGGRRIMGPEKVTEGTEIAQFADPEGHVVGLLRL
jgi:uncharacterized protein